MASFWARRFISLPVLSEAPEDPLAPALLGHAWLWDTWFPIWRPQGTGPQKKKAWESSKRSSQGLVMGLDHWYTIRVGPQQAEHPKVLSSPLSVSRSASFFY